MFLVAVPAVYRSVTGWLEGYFRLLLAFGTDYFMHFPVSVAAFVSVCHFSFTSFMFRRWPAWKCKGLSGTRCLIKVHGSLGESNLQKGYHFLNRNTPVNIKIMDLLFKNGLKGFPPFRAPAGSNPGFCRHFSQTHISACWSVSVSRVVPQKGDASLRLRRRCNRRTSWMRSGEILPGLCRFFRHIN